MLDKRVRKNFFTIMSQTRVRMNRTFINYLMSNSITVPIPRDFLRYVWRQKMKTKCRVGTFFDDNFLNIY